MTQSRVAISNELGLHLRAAARLVVVANRFKAKVTLSATGKTVDGKSFWHHLATGQKGHGGHN